MAYVYRHIRLDKDEPFYIGIGIDDKGEHKRAYDFYNGRRSIVWRRIFNKTSIEVDIMADGITPEQAKKKEIEFIALYGRRDIGTGTLTNKTNGGDFLAGLVFTEEHRRKLSEFAKSRKLTEAQKQNLREHRLGKPAWNKGLFGSLNPLYGRRLSEDVIEKGRQAKLGKKNPMYGLVGANSPKFKGMVQAYKDGVLAGEYEGSNKCAEVLSLAATKVSACLSGRRKSTGGYTFKRLPL